MKVWILVQMPTSYPIVATQSTIERFSLPLALERERGGTAGVRVRHAAIVMRELASESFHVKMVTALSGDHFGT